jgi:hypothetical protein
MRARTGLTTALTCLALGAAAGCGGDDSSEESGGESASGGGALTAAEYRKQGNALCKDAVREVEAIPAPRSPEDVADYLEKVFDSSEKVNDEFMKLEPPEDLRADHKRAVELSNESEKTFDGVAKRVREASNPQAAVVSELRKLAPALEQAEKLNTKLGLDECNETGPPAEQPEAS